ncbi:sigma-70 family RNA polymerase sigma factor [Paenibacillus sp. Y412MC10]|uniref:sigma-70 family RNA polymerase sigma factor n=1 Tax=Geobacillus sp. (strain Y412MC10) TaxID=481743 RepID=UPI0016425FC4|nr:sigma-70 family RNA polymerase sigma factor [Paenibacillus sp. Y412MC10]
MMLSDIQRRKFLDYVHLNEIIFSDRIIQDFFKSQDNILLLLKTLDGDKEAKTKLDEKFKKHFFRIRFIGFLASTIKFHAIGQMRLYQKGDSKEQLIFDMPVSSDDNSSSSSFGELLLNNQESTHFEPITSDPTEFQSNLKNHRLAAAFDQLTRKQQLIVTLYYALSYKDKEISKILNVSPQAVSKTRRTALENLRLALLVITSDI